MRILIATNAPTLKENGKFSSYAPYVKEMDIWFSNVKEVGILSPVKYPESIFTKEFCFQSVKLFKLPFFKFTTFFDSVLFVIVAPFILFQFIRSFIWADHIHLRCPGNIGLLACLVQVFFPWKPKTAKYAGNWDPSATQPWAYKMQKKILSNTFLTRNMDVLVYGKWPEQSKNIKPFFTASFKEQEKERIIKNDNPPYKFIFVGSLVEGKRPNIAMQIVIELNRRNIPAELHVFGNGNLMPHLKKIANDKDYLHINGNQPLEVVKKVYKEAHFVILASKSEGWPKALAEGMFFGCIPIATPVSCVPWMLNYGNRGIISPPLEGTGPEVRTNEGKWLEETTNKIVQLIKNPEEMRRMSLAAQDWSQHYTLEKFEEAIKNILGAEKVNRKKRVFPKGRGGSKE